MQLEAETNKSVDVHFVDDKKTEFSDCSSRARKSLCDYSCSQQQMESGKSLKGMHEKDVTIALLRREIESALESLKEVQAEMDKLQDEKEKMLMSEKQYEKNLKNLTTEVLTLEAAIDKFQKQSECNIEAINHKVEAVDHIVQEAGTYWYETKEVTRSIFDVVFQELSSIIYPQFRFSLWISILKMHMTLESFFKGININLIGLIQSIAIAIGIHWLLIPSWLIPLKQ